MALCGKDLKGTKVSVIGLGISGLETALYAKRRGAKVFLSELKAGKNSAAYQARLKSEGIEFETGKHSLDRLKQSDIAVISPGIKPSQEVYRFLADEWKGPLVSEIEFAFWYAPCEVVAVTGTNGKTTTTSLIAEMFRLFGVHAVSCGNIGNPFVAEIDNLAPDSKVSVEVSSFQLERTMEFRPHVALLLNITPDHFDWHGTMDNYVRAKAGIFRNQTKSDFAILNAQDPYSSEIAPSIKAKVIYFNRGIVENPNWDAVLQVADIYGYPRQKVMKFLREFPGIEHRLEKVPSKDGITYINDSKSTNPSSLEWALARMDLPAVLICGGRNKGNDFRTLATLVQKKVKMCVLIGEAAGEMEDAWKEVVPVTHAKDLREAVVKSRAFAATGGTVLLSPGCASFDMFLNYEDRGEKFKEIVHELSGRGNT